MLLPYLLFVVFAAANVASANVVVETAVNETVTKCTTCLIFDGQCHNSIHVLDFQAPFQKNVIITELGIHGDTVYYAFQPDLKDPEYYKVGFVNYSNPEDHGILDSNQKVSNFRNFDFEDEGKIMYIGGSDGIYCKLDGKKPEHCSSIGDNIQKIFYKKQLYFVRVDENIIYKIEGERFVLQEKIKNLKNFVLGKSNIVVFLNTTGLYARKMGTNDTVYLSKNAFFRGLTTKNKEEAYAWWIDGIYKIVIEDKLNKSKMIKIANIPTIGAVTFDKDKCWFSSGRGLYRLDQVDIKLC